MGLSLRLHHHFHGPPIDYGALAAAAAASWIGVPGPGEPVLIAAGVFAAQHRLDIVSVLVVAWARRHGGRDRRLAARDEGRSHSADRPGPAAAPPAQGARARGSGVRPGPGAGGAARALLGRGHPRCPRSPVPALERDRRGDLGGAASALARSTSGRPVIEVVRRRRLGASGSRSCCWWPRRSRPSSRGGDGAASATVMRRPRAEPTQSCRPVHDIGWNGTGGAAHVQLDHRVGVERDRAGGSWSTACR